jgi:hypothetical protein
MSSTGNERIVTAPLIALAWLGAVLVGFVVGMFVANTPLGRTIQFAAFWIALYPVARLLWLGTTTVWRWWAGLALGALVGWSLDTWRQSLSADTNSRIGIVVVGLATMAPIIWLWTARRKEKS